MYLYNIWYFPLVNIFEFVLIKIYVNFFLKRVFDILAPPTSYFLQVSLVTQTYDHQVDVITAGHVTWDFKSWLANYRTYIGQHVITIMIDQNNSYWNSSLNYCWWPIHSLLTLVSCCIIARKLFFLRNHIAKTNHNIGPTIENTHDAIHIYL